MTNSLIFQKMIRRKHPLLVEFYQEKCRDCQTMNAILKVVNHRTKSQYKIVQLNLNAYPEIASQYQIKEVPTCLVFENEELKWRESGILSATKLINLLENLSKPLELNERK